VTDLINSLHAFMEKSLNEVDEPVRVAFAGWLSRFKPQEDQHTVMILSLGKATDVQSQQPASA
jgi:hypothetical protein